MTGESLILQGGALGVVCFAFLMSNRFMMTTFARLLAKLENSVSMQTVAFTKSQARIENAQNVQTATLLGLSAQLLAHDLTVTGLNPSTGADFSERDSKAFAKYNEIQRQIADLQTKVVSQVNLPE